MKSITRERGVKTRGCQVLFGSILLGIVAIGTHSLAVDFEQEPSKFEIMTDGIFTTKKEWRDVTPEVRLNGRSFVYTSADNDLDALYLMYDLAFSTVPLAPGALAGPVHFNNGGHTFEVYFQGPPGPASSIIILKDGVVFDPSDPSPLGGEDSIEGKAGFGPSPNSAVPHNMFELEVLFDGSDPTLNGHNHGQYSPDPSHWGAALPSDPLPGQPGEPGQGGVPVPRCEIPRDPGCDANNNPTGGEPSIPVLPCPSAPPQLLDIRISFGNEVSNACVNVVRGSGGLVEITRIPLPGERDEDDHDDDEDDRDEDEDDRDDDEDDRDEDEHDRDHNKHGRDHDKKHDRDEDEDDRGRSRRRRG